MADINSYLDNITSSIKQLRQDLNDLQLEERPSEKSGLHASRPTTGLRTGDRYFSTDTGAYEYYNGTAFRTIAGAVVPLGQICRVVNDSTSRASGFSNSAVQVTGTTDLNSGSVTLPASIAGVWFSVLLITAAAGTGVQLVVENPDHVAGAITMIGQTVTTGGSNGYSGSGFVSLSSLGRLRYVYTGTANVTRTIIDIWAYTT